MNLNLFESSFDNKVAPIALMTSDEFLMVLLSMGKISKDDCAHINVVRQEKN